MIVLPVIASCIGPPVSMGTLEMEKVVMGPSGDSIEAPAPPTKMVRASTTVVVGGSPAEVTLEVSQDGEGWLPLAKDEKIIQVTNVEGCVVVEASVGSGWVQVASFYLPRPVEERPRWWHLFRVWKRKRPDAVVSNCVQRRISIVADMMRVNALDGSAARVEVLSREKPNA